MISVKINKERGFNVEKIIQFVIENWRYFVDLGSIIVCVVLFIVRKRPTKLVDGIEELILKVLPSAIVYAEAKVGAGHGDVKMTEVMALISEYIKERYPDVDFGIYTKFIKEQVEYILSTPQKKEEVVDEN